MLYRITHKTRYTYASPVSLCHSETRILPRNTDRQTCLKSMLVIEPEPAAYRERKDFFGNRVGYFAIQRAHDHLTITATSDAQVAPRNSEALTGDTPWEAVRAQMASGADTATRDARLFTLDSPLTRRSQTQADYARPSFPSGRPALEATRDLMTRIHRDFAYVPGFTTVATPLEAVMEHRRGVCQDFAHVAVACLRSTGLPARYVSGYLETAPPPGKERLIGADASHAWFSVYTPSSGWVDFDPTNNIMPDDRHIIVGWGRDFLDVTPVKGIMFGSGTQLLTVSVDVAPIMP
jgi:transglutaminase-like putative cysteine protease